MCFNGLVYAGACHLMSFQTLVLWPTRSLREAVTTLIYLFTTKTKKVFVGAVGEERLGVYLNTLYFSWVICSLLTLKKSYPSIVRKKLGNTVLENVIITPDRRAPSVLIQSIYAHPTHFFIYHALDNPSSSSYSKKFSFCL